MKPVGAAHHQRDWFWILCFAAAIVATLAAGAFTIDLALNFFLHPIRFIRIGMASVFAVSSLQWKITFALLLIAAFICLILVLFQAPRQKARDIVESLGGTRVARNSPSLVEKRLLNVVEEIAIAAGRPVPATYIMPNESGINAFTAGTEQWDTCLVVTRGATRLLKRAELQAVVAHEFGHIVSGDVRRNTILLRFLAVLLPISDFAKSNPLRRAGVLFIVFVVSAALAQAVSFFGIVALICLVWLIFLLPFAVISTVWSVGTAMARNAQAGFARDREFAADSSSARFTRDPASLAAALRKIGGIPESTNLSSRGAGIVSHMCIAPAVAGWSEGPGATHPRLEERLERIGFPLTNEQREQLNEYDASIQPRYASEVTEEMGIMQFGGATAPAATRETARAPEPAQAPEPERPLKPHVAPAPEPMVRAPLPAVRATPGPAVRFAEAVSAAPDPQEAAKMLAVIPADLREALRTEEGARAAALALISDHVDPASEPLCARFAMLLDRYGASYRLPLFALAAPALTSLEQEKRRALTQELRALVLADGKVTVREIVYFVLLSKALAERSRKRAALTPEDAARAFSIVLGAAVYYFCKTDEEVRAAFVTGARETRYSAELPPKNSVNLSAVERALEQLANAGYLETPRIARAVAAALAHDGTVTMPEMEFVRAVAVALDCPIPQVVIG